MQTVGCHVWKPCWQVLPGAWLQRRKGAGTGTTTVWCNSSDKTSPEHGAQSHLTHSDCLTPTILSTLAAFQKRRGATALLSKLDDLFQKGGASWVTAVQQKQEDKTKTDSVEIKRLYCKQSLRYHLTHTTHKHTKDPFVILLPRSVSCGKPGWRGSGGGVGRERERERTFMFHLTNLQRH